MADRSALSRQYAHSAGRLLLASMLALATSIATTLPGSAQDEGTVTVGSVSGELGTYLVGPDGRTLYTFTKDVTPGVSVCSGGCLEAWPPLLVEEGQQLAAGEGVTGVLGLITGTDGSTQGTYDGRPLYYYQGDTEAAQTNGQGLFEVWFVAAVDGSMPANPPALTLATATSDLGTFLTGRDGLTIYFFAADTVPGVSVCEGDCLATWPPVSVPPGNSVAGGDGVTGVLGLITGTDGSTQVTYDGRPLYYFQGDTEAGQTNGQGLSDVWWVADVSGSLPAS